MAAGETSSISPTFPVVRYFLERRFGASAPGPADARMRELYQRSLVRSGGKSYAIRRERKVDLAHENGGLQSVRIWHSPCSGGTVPEEQGPVSEPSEGAKQVTILVVDDEPEVRALVREMLELHGYKVIDTGDPVEARRLTESQPVHLLLTDVVMPIMSGIELAKRVEAVSPTTKIILMSGYSTAAVLGSGRPLVSKPFKTNDLVKTVRQVLDSKSAFRRPGPPSPPRPGSGPV
jgi:CheY-like chemotaxis protein